MSATTILQRPAYDRTNCDNEPIHIPGGIQPIGFLIAATSDWIVTRASQNVSEWLGAEAQDLLGTPLAKLLGAEATHTIRNRMAILGSGATSERVFGVALLGDERRFDISLHLSQGTLVLECEPSGAAKEAGAATVVGTMVGRLQQVADVPTFCRMAARSVRALTGFDRVMIYKFHPDGSGEVVADAVGGGIESYLGLRYPATDIPQQARALYERNWLRLIADIDAEPVPVVPPLSPEGESLDLSMSTLRAVSPVHIEYLRNMGVAASMSISILREGRLWGLIACHHMTPLRPSFERRTAAELFGQMFSLLLETRERSLDAGQDARARELHNALMSSISTDGTLAEGLDQFLDIMGELIPSDGVGMFVDGRVRLTGDTPDRREFGALVRFLNQAATSRIYSTDGIGLVHVPGRDFADRAAGLLAIPISRDPRDYVVFFRREIARSVTWAGEPVDRVETDGGGQRIAPRSSFAAWREIVRGKSAPWSPTELRVAETLRATLLEMIVRLANESSRERAAVADRQELVIAELNHRVRNILGLMRGLIARSSDSHVTVEKYAEVLGARVQALARAHDQVTKDQWGPAPLHALVRTEAVGFMGERGSARLKADGPEVSLAPEAFSTLALVLHELLTNSAKYGSLSTPDGTVEMQWSRAAGGDLSIVWHEKGGPAVSPPLRRGFGSTVIERSIPHELKGEANVEHRVEGVYARFVIPSRYVSVVGTMGEGGSAVRGDARLSGHVLLVEDNMIIALDAEDMVLQLGADSVKAAGSVAGAQMEIDANRPDFAVLDINLGDETSYPVASRLMAAGVPFVFATGYGDEIDLPEEFARVPVVKKPYLPETIAAAFAKHPGAVTG